MIKYQFFPRSQGLTENIKVVVDCFNLGLTSINSNEFMFTSNQVLEIIRPYLEKNDFIVESGKSNHQKN